jgi:hypothetical protein
MWGDLMKRFFGAMLAAVIACGLVNQVRLRADEQDAKAILERAIKAIGGAEKLGKIEAYTWKAKGKITLGENENDFTSHLTVQGIDRVRAEFESEFNGNEVKGVTIIDGDKGWRKFGDNLNELDANAVANEKRSVYLQVVSTTLVPLKGNGFKYEAAGEEKVGDKPAAVLKATGPDGKDFKLYFDKERGMLVKLVATMMNFQGEEVLQESTYANYKDFAGIKKATKTEVKRDGQKFVDSELLEFKVLDKVDPETFAEPK